MVLCMVGRLQAGYRTITTMHVHEMRSEAEMGIPEMDNLAGW